MKLRIVHQLSLLLLGAVVLSMATVGGVVFWNLRGGFGEYLRARDDAQLGRFVQLVERRAAVDPSMAWLRGSRAAMESMGDEFTTQEGFGRPPPRPGPPPRRERAPPPEGEGPSEGVLQGPHASDRPPPPLQEGPREGPRGEPGPPPADDPPERRRRPPEGILGRVQIFDLQGRHLAGRAQPQGPSVETRAVKVDGREVAWVRLTREPHLAGVDARFLERQYTGLALAMAGTLAVMLALAWWIAGRWSRPLRRLQQATRRMAQGELGVQVRPQGAREIASLIDDVNSLSSNLARLESARRVWIAQISHELRTPLAVLRGEIESIEDGARAATPAVIASLREEVMQLIRLVGDLHTLSMADLGQLHCVFADTSVHGLMQRLQLRFAARAQAQGLVLQLDPAPDGADCQACWDQGRIEQVLGNLLENSLRYTQAPGRLRVGWQRLAGAVRITVEDSAPGVSAADLPLLFEPLFRGDAARGRAAAQGSGLGLSIAQAIVQAHKGRIRASASALGGLCVTVDLPLQT